MGRAALPRRLAAPPTWVGPHLATSLLDLATPRHASRPHPVLAVRPLHLGAARRHQPPCHQGGRPGQGLGWRRRDAWSGRSIRRRARACPHARGASASPPASHDLICSTSRSIGEPISASRSAHPSTHSVLFCSGAAHLPAEATRADLPSLQVLRERLDPGLGPAPLL